ncbi:hypothetical protein, partial [Streptomyces sudanensis]
GGAVAGSGAEPDGTETDECRALEPPTATATDAGRSDDRLVPVMAPSGKSRPGVVKLAFHNR